MRERTVHVAQTRRVERQKCRVFADAIDEHEPAGVLQLALHRLQGEQLAEASFVQAGALDVITDQLAEQRRRQRDVAVTQEADQVVQQHFLKVFGLLLLCVLIIFAGVLALCVGIFIAAPVVFAATAIAYEELFAEVPAR